MKYNLPSRQLFPTVTFLFLLFSSINTFAQSIEPDEQIKREMIAYAARIENALDSSRPRIVYKTPSADKTGRYPELREDKTLSSKHLSMERQAFDLLNDQRLERGLKPLKWSEDAAKAARFHSENMARYKFFSHVDQEGLSVNKRARALRIGGWMAIGENIAFNKGFRKPVEMACQHWMASSGHRSNILDSGWTDSGIGVAVAPDGSHYFTQVFFVR